MSAIGPFTETNSFGSNEMETPEGYENENYHQNHEGQVITRKVSSGRRNLMVLLHSIANEKCSPEKTSKAKQWYPSDESKGCCAKHHCLQSLGDSAFSTTDDNSQVRDYTVK